MILLWQTANTIVTSLILTQHSWLVGSCICCGTLCTPSITEARSSLTHSLVYRPTVPMGVDTGALSSFKPVEIPEGERWFSLMLA